jgi:Flp pilus assembly protein TadD
LAFVTKKLRKEAKLRKEFVWIQKSIPNAAIAFINQEDFDRAIADFSEACRLDPNLDEAKNNLSITIRHVKNMGMGACLIDAPVP